jgi:hypothetical protein
VVTLAEKHRSTTSNLLYNISRKLNREPDARTHKGTHLFCAQWLMVLTEENINEENVDEDIEKVEELDQVQPHRPVVVAVQVVPQIPTHHFANTCNPSIIRLNTFFRRGFESKCAFWFARKLKWV